MKLVYVAFKLGMVLTPLMQNLIPPKEFSYYYYTYDGIIVGDSHAVAKTPERLVDSDGTSFKGTLTEMIFFAWTNKP